MYRGFMPDLDRFKRAQADPTRGFAVAVGELQSGQKRSHWIWYIFPQLAGLGQSPLAMRYGLQGVAEAEDYLRDPVLRTRLLAVTAALANHLGPRPTPALAVLMGSKIDALKLVSSLTLFRAIARRLEEKEPHVDCAGLAQEADTVLRAASAQGIPECAFTRAQLESPRFPSLA